MVSCSSVDHADRLTGSVMFAHLTLDFMSLFNLPRIHQDATDFRITRLL